MRGEIFKEGIGEGWISPSIVRCNEYYSFNIGFKSGREIPPGGMIRFEFPYAFSCPQMTFVECEGYTTVKVASDVKYEVLLLPSNYENSHPLFRRRNFYYVTRYGRHMVIWIKEGILKKGEEVIVKYGDTPHHQSKGAKTPYFEGEFEFTLAVKLPYDPAPYSGFYLVENSPKVRVLPSSPEKIEVILSSTHKEKVKGKVFLLDRYGNVCSHSFRSNIKLLSEKGECLKKFKLSQNPHQFILPFQKRGYILVKKNDTLFKSNPTIVKEEYSLYWGDLHGHSKLSDGLGSAKSYYLFGKEKAALDFCALTDHAQYMEEEDWEEIKKATEEFYTPGEFVTILGQEYSFNLPPNYGDLNIYYPHLDAPLFRPYDISRLPSSFHHLPEVIEKVKSLKGLIIYHQHAKGNRIYDPDVTRLIEIYSIWGCAEYPENPLPLRPVRSGIDYHGHTAQDYLKKKWILGFTGGSDCHAGHPGRTDWLRIGKAYLNGLTGLWAESLTREKIWEALFNRRCYATTGQRSILKFKWGDKWMGEVIKGNPSQNSFYIEIYAESRIRKIEIIRNNSVLYSFSNRGNFFEKEIEDSSPLPHFSYYYVRVEEENNRFIWSSPIFFTEENL